MKDRYRRGIIPDFDIWETGVISATEINRCFDQVATTVLSESYIKQAKEFTIKRSAIAGYEELKAMGEEISRERIMEKISEMNHLDIDFNYRPIHIREVLKDVFRMICESNYKDMISFGFKSMDDDLYGIEKEELVVVAGSTSVGKTSLAIKILIENSVKRDYAGAYFAIESGRKIIMARIFSQMTKIPLKNIMVNQLDLDDKEKILQTMETLGEKRIIIDDLESLNVNKLKILAETYKIENDIQYIIIDHLNDMASDEKFSSPYQERSTQVSEIKKLARHLKIPIILLCQLSRGEYLKGKEPPSIFNIRDSGRIAEIADKVIILYKENKFGDEYIAGVQKNRNGPKRDFRLLFMKEYAGFKELVE